MVAREGIVDHPEFRDPPSASTTQLGFVARPWKVADGDAFLTPAPMASVPIVDAKGRGETLRLRGRPDDGFENGEV
jgi:hypothetical protein